MAEFYRSSVEDSQVDRYGRTVDERAEELVDSGLFNYVGAYARVTGTPPEPGWEQYQFARAALLRPKDIAEQPGNGEHA